MKKIYLACPYSHPNKKVRHERFLKAVEYAGFLITQGNIVFCPVCHSHPIALYNNLDKKNSSFWLEQDLPFLPICDEIRVLMLDGWDKSLGGKIEIETGESLGLPIRYVAY